jgi:ABC-2 type transport system ATP-binding protein
MDEGQIKETGSLRDMLTRYKGRDPFETLPPDVLERLGAAPVLPNGSEDT